MINASYENYMANGTDPKVDGVVHPAGGGDKGRPPEVVRVRPRFTINRKLSPHESRTML